jgi:hypothetical protein
MKAAPAAPRLVRALRPKAWSQQYAFSEEGELSHETSARGYGARMLPRSFVLFDSSAPGRVEGSLIRLARLLPFLHS